LAAEALVLRLQVTEASLKGQAAGTRGELHNSIIGEAREAAALPQPPPAGLPIARLRDLRPQRLAG
jgi:hypothetical protein